MNTHINDFDTRLRALAAEGLTLKTIAEQLGVSESKVNTELRRLNVEAPWKIRRRNRHEAQQAVRQAKAALTEATSISPSYLVRRYLDGETLEEIGLSVDLSRERVRQIIVEGGYSVKELRTQRNDAAAKLFTERQQAVASWIEAHKGCTPAELENHFGVSMQQLDEFLTPRLRILVLTEGEDEKTGQYSAYTKWSKEQILLALRQAAKKTSPLTREAYDRHVASKAVIGPVGSRIVHIFKTWTLACAIAGVESGEAVRDNYEKEFTTNDLVEALVQFIQESESLSTESYDKWEAQRQGLPSGITIRLKFGSWTAARRRALEVLRASWATSQE